MEHVADILSHNMTPVIIGLCVIVALVLKHMTTVVTTVSRERSRREIAAYIAEGSISPEQGERLMGANAGRTSACREI